MQVWRKKETFHPSPYLPTFLLKGHKYPHWGNMRLRASSHPHPWSEAEHRTSVRGLTNLVGVKSESVGRSVVSNSLQSHGL